MIEAILIGFALAYAGAHFWMLTKGAA